MEETLRNKLIEVWENYHKNSREVGEIVSSYFGAENVDYQENSIERVMGNDLFGHREEYMDYSSEESIKRTYEEVIRAVYSSNQILYPIVIVHFPAVTVTNEYDESVDITHLYARIRVMPTGKMVCRFDCTRSEYPVSHVLSDYMHSHCSHVPIRSGDTPWVNACTGNDDTAINMTIHTLTLNFEPLIWRMFCVELNNFTQVESIAGTPYHRLKEIGASVHRGRAEELEKETVGVYHNSDNALVKDFLYYYTEHNNLKFVYQGNRIDLGMSMFEYRLDLTKKFIEWFNIPENPYNRVYSMSRLLRKHILKKYYVSNSKIYELTSSSSEISIEDVERYNGKTLFKFKGEPIKVHIIGMEEDNSDDSVTLVGKNIAAYILSAILLTVNFNYGTTSEHDGSSSSVSCGRIYL